MQPKIYISYSWSPESLAIADTIDKDWAAAGITLIRDKRDLGYKQSLRAFMQGMSKGDYVLVIISKGYLESKNCMFEALELFQDPAFQDKILPVITPSANIHSALGKLSYIKFWENAIKELNDQLREIGSLSNMQTIYEELEHYERIRKSISEFSGVLTDMVCATWPHTKDSNYQDIFKYLGLAQDDALQEVIRINEIQDVDAQLIAFEQLFIRYPNDVHTLFFKANSALEEGKYLLSKMYFEKLLNQFPYFARGHQNFAVLLADHLADFEKADKHFNTALRLNPTNVRILVNYARYLRFHINNSPKAREYYQKALAIDPKDATAHYNMAIMLKHDFHEFDLAKYHYLQSLDADPTNPDTHYNLGNLLREYYQDYVLAQAHYERAAALAPSISKYHINLGLTAAHSDDLNSAKLSLLTAINKEPNNVAATYNLGVLFQSKFQDLEQAHYYYRRTIEIEPDHAQAHNNLALVLYHLGKIEGLDGAIAHYTKAVALRPDFKDEMIEALLFN
jgi:tetratricopeptide (TPR) repeat protein